MIEYNLMNRRYSLDGIIRPKQQIYHLLRRRGHTFKQIDTTMTAARIMARAEYIAQPDDRIDEEAGIKLFVSVLCNALARDLAIRAALRYIPAHLKVLKHPNQFCLASMKHDFEWGTKHYISAADYAECLKQCGLKVEGEKVFAKEIS